MAIVFSQGIFLWADLLTDLTGSGSDDGITTDQIGWAEDQNNWYYCVTVAAGTSTWTALATGGGSGELGAAVEDTGATNPALMDATFTWQIAQTQSLTFENATSNNDLLVLAPASGADAVTVGWGFATGGGDSFIVNAQTCDINSTLITLEYATWPPSDGTGGQRLQTDGAGTLSWVDASGGAAVSTLVQVDVTQSTGSLSASGGTVDLDISSFINEGSIISLSVTRTAGTGGNNVNIEIFTKDTFLAGDRIYFAEAADASTAFIDRSGAFYEDEDTTSELHIRITNNSASAATFDVRARAQGESSAGGPVICSIREISTGTTLSATTDHVVLCETTGGAFTVTLPAASGNVGLKYQIKNIGTNTLTVDGNASETIDGALTAVLPTQNDSITIVCDGTEWWIL